MSSADSQAYAEESGDVLSRMNSHIQSNQRLREGIISTEEASDQFRSAARADKIAGEGAIAGGAASGGAAVGIATSVIKNARKAFRAGKALSQLRGKLGNLRKGAQDGIGDELGDEPSTADTAAETTVGPSATGDPYNDLRTTLLNFREDVRADRIAAGDDDPTLDPFGVNEDEPSLGIGSRPTVSMATQTGPPEPPAGEQPPAPATTDAQPAPPAPTDAQPPALGGKGPTPPAGDNLTAPPSAEELLAKQVSSTTDAGTEQLGATASKLFGGELGDVADIGKLLAGGGDIADTLAGLATGGAAESLGLLGAASIATEALGPLSMFAGAGVGIWQAVSEEKAESKAADNAKKYEVMAQSLSAAPQLQTGSIAMPAMDSSQFRSGGLSNF